MIFSTNTIMLSRPLREMLHELQHEVTQTIPNLNCGGCGIFASEVAKRMARLGYEVEVITPSHRGSVTPLEISKNVSNRKSKKCITWDDLGLHRNHLAVRFKSRGLVYTYDSTALLLGGKKFGSAGFYVCRYGFGKGLTWQQASKLARDKTAWNQEFDRVYTDLLKSIIRRYFDLFEFRLKNL